MVPGGAVSVISVQNLTNHRVIADQCSVAERFFPRLKGLMGRTHMESGEALLFPRCNSIHMWFMQMPIDVVFLKTEISSDGKRKAKVVSAHAHVRPWRFLPLSAWSANETLELAAGTIQRMEISVGDELCIG